MAHVQDAGDIGRRNDYAIRFFRGICLGIKRAAALPMPYRSYLRLHWDCIALGSSFMKTRFSPFINLYSTLSTRACQLASMIFSETPMVHHEPFESCDWIGYAHLCRGACFFVEHADLKIRKMHVGKPGIKIQKRFSERVVERVDRAVSDAGSMLYFAFYPDLDEWPRNEARPFRLFRL